MTVLAHHLVMSVFQENLPANETHCEHEHTALLLQSGELSHNGLALKAISGIYVRAGDQLTSTSKVQLIRFDLTTPTIGKQQTEVVPTPALSNPVNTIFAGASNKILMRLDQVDFPPGAIAYRHTHPGAGIRYLVHGSLLIESDHGSEQMEQGQAWFEDADSPVRATAGSKGACFVRLMLLPVEYEGRPTLNTLDPSDAAKPRLQTNTRYFDQRIEIDHVS